MLKRILISFIFLTGLAACTTVNPVTGREQVMLFPASQDVPLGSNALAEVRKTAPVLSSGPMVERVKRVGARIAAVSDAPNYPWEFIVIDQDVLNAWALPGGKVAIYTKMLRLFPSDAELAAIVGHEVAHAVLRHGAERMSRAQLEQFAILGLGVAAGVATKDENMMQTAMVLGSLAAQGFSALPHSRFTELEADDIGTLYMARAGYDPRAAVRVWEIMAREKGAGGSPPEFMSTHPDDGRRADRLRAKMQEYLAEYEFVR